MTHKPAPVAPAPHSDPDIVLATLDPHPIAINVYHTVEEAEAARIEKGLDDSYRPMSWEEYDAAKSQFFLDQPLKAETAESYDKMLNALPPHAWQRVDGVERFIMAEAEYGSVHRQYAHRGDRYASRLVNILDRKTWITGDEMDRARLEKPGEKVGRS